MTIDLRSLGWDAEFDAAYAPFDGAGTRPGRVVRVDRGVSTVLTRDGAVRASLCGDLLARAAADPAALPCAGDWLAVRRWPDERLTVEAVLPRRTAVVRAGAGRTALGQVLAANVDSVAVVEPIDPAPDLGRIERLLALAWESGAEPFVVLTKADLARTARVIAGQIAAVAPGSKVYAVSARTGRGLEKLRAPTAHGRTLGLLGASGSGKSSLVNALVGASVMEARELRADGRGRHTTTYRALVPIPGGGAVLDTPGIRLVGLFDAADGLDRAFADITALAATCRFGDCRHDGEPGCAVRAALESGALSPRRHASWRTLSRELARSASRRDGRLAAEEARRRSAELEYRRARRAEERWRHGRAG